MKKLEKLRILDGTSLKLIAMISMVFDHVGDMFFPSALWMRMIGRLAMPCSPSASRRATLIPKTSSVTCCGWASSPW